AMRRSAPGATPRCFGEGRSRSAILSRATRPARRSTGSSSARSIRRESSTAAACIRSYDGNSLMQTAIADFIRDTPEGREADSILRKCVHCGFCTATCPTYLLLGDENDGPRGRIYLMKQALEGQEITDRTRLHLDRCLTCRACETTCPSGVQYGRLLDIGRKLAGETTARPAWERV